MKYLTKTVFLLLGLFLFSVPFGTVRAATAKTELGTIELVEDTFKYTGEECRPEFTVYDVDGKVVDPDNYTCEYISAVNAGNEKTKIYVKAKDDSEYKGSLKKQFYITPESIEKAAVSEISDQVYTGGQIKPLPNITYKGKTLTKGTDYTLTYQNNKNAGTATVIITGSATANEDKTNKNFSGKVTVTFEITPLSIENCIIEAIEDKTYNGSPITPGIKLMFDGQRLSSARYKLTYKNNVNAGTATVIATGVGDYCGTVSANFTIVPKQATPKIVLSKTKYVYDGTVKKPKVKSVTVGSDEIPIDSSAYTVKYSSGCKNAGTYKVTVTLKGNYSGKNTKSFIIAPQSIHEAEIKLAKRTFTYSGKAFKPEVTVTLKGTTLKKGTDYKVTYSSNKNAGNGTVQIEGIGNYTHKSAKYSFVIRKDIQNFAVSSKADSFKISYSKVKKAKQSLSASKILNISDPIGAVTYEIGYASGGYFTIDKNTGTVSVAKGTPKGTYSLTLKLCAEGDANHMKCYRLVNIKIKVK